MRRWSRCKLKAFVFVHGVGVNNGYVSACADKLHNSTRIADQLGVDDRAVGCPVNENSVTAIE